MSEAKKEFEVQREKTLTKMKDWENNVSWSKGQIEEILRSKQDVPVSEVRGVLGQINDRLSTAATSIHKSSDDLDYLDNFFKFQKSNFEVRKFAFDSWPASRYVEQMLWVATVLISLGGGAFATGMALTSGDLLASIIAPGVFWAIGLALLVVFLARLREIDSQKMEFYRREFGLDKDLPAPSKKN